MVARATVSRWTPWGVLTRVGAIIKTPSDLLLGLRVGLFLLSAPTSLEMAALPRWLDRLRSLRRPSAPDLPSGIERIARLRYPWFRLPRLQGRNNCYLRALTLYRFLDVGDRELRIHFGVEPGVDSEERLKGHAWVSVDGCNVETPAPVREGKVREVYVHSARS